MRDLGAAFRIDDIEVFTKRLVIARLKIEGRHLAPCRDLEVVIIAMTIRHGVVEKVGQPCHAFLDFFLDLGEFRFFGAEILLERFHLFAGVGIVFAFLSKVVALRAYGFDVLQELQVRLVQFKEGVDVDVDAASGAVGFDTLGVGAEDFYVYHDYGSVNGGPTVKR